MVRLLLKQTNSIDFTITSITERSTLPPPPRSPPNGNQHMDHLPAAFAIASPLGTRYNAAIAHKKEGSVPSAFSKSLHVSVDSRPPLPLSCESSKNTTITLEGTQTLCELSYSAALSQRPSAVLEFALTPEVAQ